MRKPYKSAVEKQVLEKAIGIAKSRRWLLREFGTDIR
jgi:hypothetical protein